MENCLLTVGYTRKRTRNTSNPSEAFEHDNNRKRYISESTMARRLAALSLELPDIIDTSSTKTDKHTVHISDQDLVFTDSEDDTVTVKDLEQQLPFEYDEDSRRRIPSIIFKSPNNQNPVRDLILYKRPEWLPEDVTVKEKPTVASQQFDDMVKQSDSSQISNPIDINLPELDMSMDADLEDAMDSQDEDEEMEL